MGAALPGKDERPDGPMEAALPGSVGAAAGNEVLLPSLPLIAIDRIYPLTVGGGRQWGWGEEMLNSR